MQFSSFVSYCAQQSASPNPSSPVVHTVMDCFHRCFADTYNTVLKGGADEPLYQPAQTQQDKHVIYFSHDYVASALHEVAHWCIAGEQRRQQVDYGYWYQPDGRSDSEQSLFEQVEVKPQALEWVFSVCAGQPFCISVDNLSNPMPVSAGFKAAVVQQAQYYCEQGLPIRAQLFQRQLLKSFQVIASINATYFDIGRL